MMWWCRCVYVRHVTLSGELLEEGQEGLEGNFELIRIHNSYAHGERERALEQCCDKFRW